MSLDDYLCERGVMTALASNTSLSNKRCLIRRMISVSILEIIVMAIDSNTASVFFFLEPVTCCRASVCRNGLYCVFLGGLGCMRSAAWWSAPLRDMIRALLLSNDATLGWLTSQLTDSALLVSSGWTSAVPPRRKPHLEGHWRHRPLLGLFIKPCP